MFGGSEYNSTSLSWKSHFINLLVKGCPLLELTKSVLKRSDGIHCHANESPNQVEKNIFFPEPLKSHFFTFFLEAKFITGKKQRHIFYFLFLGHPQYNDLYKCSI